MDSRKFDAIIKALGDGSAPASRRRLLQVAPALAAIGILGRPGRGRALDGGQENEPPATITCRGSVDCAPGQACVNGSCQPFPAAVGAPSTAATTPAAVGAVTPATTSSDDDAVPAATASADDAASSDDDAAPVATASADDAASSDDAAAPAATASADDATSIAAGGQTDETPDPGISIPEDQPLSTGVYAGICGQLTAERAFSLIEIGVPGGGTPVPTDQPLGQPTALPARFSTTVIEANLDDLLVSPLAIDIRLDADDPATSIACGDIGGQPNGPTPDPELAIGLAERNNSGAAGIGLLRDQGERTLVNVFVAPGLAGGGTTTGSVSFTETPVEPDPDATEPADETPTATPVPDDGLAAGTIVYTAAEVNLRAAPSTDAAIIAVLGGGAELEITENPSDGWIPVRERSTGRRGYITEEFIAETE